MAKTSQNCKSAEKCDSLSVLSPEDIESRIYLVRGLKVMIDSDLAILYGVKTKALVQSVKRNKIRFPHDFLIRLNKEEFDRLRSHFVTSKRGGKRYLPYAFTEQGIAMLSSILKSKRAALVNIAIMRAFVRIRQLISFNKDLVQKLAEIEHKLGQHDQDINELFAIVGRLLQFEEQPKKKFGFETGV